MSETALPQSNNARAVAPGIPALWQPVLLRAVVTLAFGLVTVFWAEPGVLGLCIGFAGYFLALAATQYWVVRTLELPRGHRGRLVLLGAAGFLAMSGVVVAISATTVVAAGLGGAALAVMGAAELFAALGKSAAETKAKLALRSDWIISGFLGLGTGILLPFFAGAGPHALIGVSGGGALMIGALWALSALTLHHDGTKVKAQ